ncbi:MAG TPA: SpoIID/LytB domain-containing protein [Mycobacteriales bacterium]|nr:SpoIID/LytB domain-containing protein [Mycobacteriales bacterium]
MRHSPLRSVRAAVAFAVCAAGVLLPALAAPSTAHAEVTVSETYPRPADGVFKLEGHGWGHGRGLNQWGAHGAARSGVTYDRILGTYYPGTAMATLPDAPIRALLEYDDEVDVAVRNAAGLSAGDLATGARYPLPGAPARWRITVDAAGLHLEHFTDSTWQRWTAPDGKSVWSGPLQFDGLSPLRVLFADGTARDYRGTVRGVRTSSTALQTVNVLGLEDYLRGVVPRESPAFFHAEALKAQSVAARSYSANKRERAPASAQADICSTTQCQVYGGMRLVSASGTTTELENPATSAAIDATAGQVRTHNGSVIFAEFSASNGGFSTAHAVFPYLAAKADPWDALESPHHYWTAQVTAAEIEAKYPSVGRLARVRVLSRDGNGEWGGRVKRVVLEGTTASGTATSVEATGGGIYAANPWAGGSDTGVRGSWWRVRSTSYDAGIISSDAAPRLVRPPGAATAALSVVVENRGGLDWPAQDLHLALALPPGGADELSKGSTRPGTFVRNVTEPGAAVVRPGQRAELRLAFDATSVPAGTYSTAYRLRIGNGQLFGPNVALTVSVVEPTLTASRVSVGGAPASGDAPAPVSPDGTVIVPRAGRTAVTVRIRNTGNVAWPVGGAVKLGAAGPRGRTSASAGPTWPHPTRAALLSGADGIANASRVEPGQVGVFSFHLSGNNAAVGSTTEVFEPIWEGFRWVTGAPVTLQVLRYDDAVSRLAQLTQAVPAALTTTNHPGSVTTLVVRARNLGRDAWPVGGDALVTAPAGRASPMRAPSWPAPDRVTTLRANLSRPGVAAVHPGEVGEWQLPLSAARLRAGDYTESFSLAAGSARYGPTVTVKVTVREAQLAAVVAKVVSSALVVPRAGTATAYVELRNTGTVVWPVGGSVRLGVPSGRTSPSRHASWLAAARPTAVTSNVTRPGATEVRPGETARLVFRLAGNNRAPGAYSETFGALWEGWRWMAAAPVIRYSVR